MGATANKRQTMAKIARERMVKERRLLKDERKLARRAEATEVVGDSAAGTEP